MKLLLTLALSIITLTNSSDAFAINCSVSIPTQSIHCSADNKKEKFELAFAAGKNCRSMSFIGFNDSTSSFGDCNSNGTKCKDLRGKCLPGSSR